MKRKNHYYYGLIQYGTQPFAPLQCVEGLKIIQLFRDGSFYPVIEILLGRINQLH
jgi:hypothetical protein